MAVTDVVAHRVEDGALTLVRQLFQGKVNADVRFSGDGPHFASLQAGAYRADRVSEGAAPIEMMLPYIMPSDIRTRPLAPFRESQRTVDLGAAELIVSVGRGIKEADNIPLIEKLAQALGAELAASRPICDAGWLPMERQVGSSGQTVAPKTVHGYRHLRRHPAPGGHEGRAHRGRHQQRRRRPDFRNSRLRHRRRFVPGCARAD